MKFLILWIWVLISEILILKWNFSVQCKGILYDAKEEIERVKVFWKAANGVLLFLDMEIGNTSSLRNARKFIILVIQKQGRSFV